MAKYLLYLLLLLNLLGTNNAQAYCYASQWGPKGPVLSSVYGNNGSTLAYCQSLACQIYPQIEGCSVTQAPAPVTCTSSFVERTETCPVNQSGIKKYKQETKTCTDGQTTVYPWQLYANTCVQNPPTCQAQSQTQTLACQTGYTGSIQQTRTSTCPDPYGSPVWSGWLTTSDSCVKSLTNVTNVMSPVSPISPINQAMMAPPTMSISSTSVQTIPSAPATVETSVPTTTSSGATNSATSNAPAAVGSVTPGTAQTNAGGTPPPKGKINIGGLGLALSLELISKPTIPQANLFPTMDFGQPIPKEMLMNDQTMMELLQVRPLTQIPLKEELDYTQ